MTTNKRKNKSEKVMDKDAVTSQQQQILFDESELINKTEDNDDNLLNITQQIIFDNDAHHTVSIEDDTLDDVNVDESAMQQFTKDKEQFVNAKLSWVWRVLISIFMLIVVIEATQFFIEGFSRSPIITSLYAALLAVLSVMSIRTLWQEFVGLRQFKKQQEFKQHAIVLLSQPLSSKEQSSVTDVENTKVFCQKLTDSLPCDLVFDDAKEHEVWRDAQTVGLSSKELVQLYSRVVLSKVDEKALNEIAKFSTEAVVLVALSPVAIIDMLIMLSRNLRMINKIAGLYGLKLGYWSRIKLIKQVFINMAYAGASEIIADFGSDMLGAELLGKLSSRFAQGLGAGMLTARLGIQTVQLCRPIPFDEKPKLTQIRRKISKQIKELVSSANK